MTVRVRLSQVPLPDFGGDRPPERLPAEVHLRRLAALYRAAGCDWVVVYGDREHAANIAWCSGYDPRFEEALLLLGPHGARRLLVGNEGLAYAADSAVADSVVLCQSFSLMGQDRSKAPRLDAILSVAGLEPGQTIGVAGWKYLAADESSEPIRPAFVPAFVRDAIESVVGLPSRDITPVLMDAESGLRATNSSDQIVALEWAAIRSSLAVQRVIRNTRPGLTEEEAVVGAGYRGEPLSAHLMFASGDGEIVGLRSPGGRRLQPGDAVTTAIGFWGSLTCRAGLLTSDVDHRFFDDVAVPYFRAVVAWYQTLEIGVTGDEVARSVDEAFGSAPFRPLLNPGHLISIDEWVHSPIELGSQARLGSGMALQSDIIPDPLPPGTAINCEDTVVLADASARSELEQLAPATWRRIAQRRRFMREGLGIELSEAVLPLSNAPGYLAPFWLIPDYALVVG